MVRKTRGRAELDLEVFRLDDPAGKFADFHRCILVGMSPLKRSNPFEPFLDHPGEVPGVVILDGGLATELEARGANLADELWSARLLLDDPQAIAEVHRAYLEAGADVIIAATYQATLEGFCRRGLEEAAPMRRRFETLDLTWGS